MPEEPADPDATGSRADDAWVRRLQAGDNEAYERLVRTYGPRLLNVARRYVTEEQDARDVVQTAFCAAFTAIGTFRQDASLGTWLHRVVVNAALSHLRARRRRPEEPIDALLPQYQADGHRIRRRGEPEAGIAPALDAIERREAAAVLRASIARLPSAYRTVLLLRDVEGLSTQETAAALGVTAEAVKVRLHRSRRALMTLVQERLGLGT